MTRSASRGTGPTPPEPKPKRGGRILVAAAIGVVLLVATGYVANAAPPDTEPDPTPPPTEVPDGRPQARAAAGAGAGAGAGGSRGPRAERHTKPFISSLTLWWQSGRVRACATATAASSTTRPWSSCGSGGPQVEQGAHPEEVAAALGMTRAAVYSWLAKYREGGLEALKARPVPGRPPS